MLLALDGPAEDQLGAALGYQPGQFADASGRYAADLFRPFGGFGRLVGTLAQEIGQEFFKSERIGVDELLVVQLFGVQHMSQCQHQGHVGHRVDVLALATQIVLGLALDRINADDLDLAGCDLALELGEVVVGLVGFAVPADLEVLDRVTGPEDDRVAVLEDDFP